MCTSVYHNTIRIKNIIILEYLSRDILKVRWETRQVEFVEYLITFSCKYSIFFIMQIV